jgi:hypothetical protein
MNQLLKNEFSDKGWPKEIEGTQLESSVTNELYIDIHKNSPNISVWLSLRNAPKTLNSANVLGKTQNTNEIKTLPKSNGGIRIQGQISIS